MADSLHRVYGGALARMILRPKGAFITGDGLRRRHLFRTWDARLPRLGWLCLNPSTADALQDDQSVRKMVGFARRLGYGAIDVANLFDWRTAYPTELYVYNLKLSSEANDGAILLMARSTDQVVCGWGRHGMHQNRALNVLRLLKERGHAAKLRVLKINADGSPAHPLMLPFRLRPVIYKEALWPK